MHFNDINKETYNEIIKGVYNSQPVSGLTHNFYKYPARFSPLFARAIINAFTKPGDIVFDPFMGGGTTLIEAQVLGRQAIGIDINSLAAFITRVKTTPLTENDISTLQYWFSTLSPKLNLHNPPKRDMEWIELGYQKNISNKKTWPIRKTLEFAIDAINELNNEKQQRFARCVLLRTAQWALDCRENIPSAKQFRKQLLIFSEEMLEGAREYSSYLFNYIGNRPFNLCLHRSAIGIESEFKFSNLSSPNLILTSPPYPGVHVLYHRWQIQGRKETPAPFWIAHSLDGNGASYYTFGYRKQKNLQNYFEQAKTAFSSIARISNKKTLMVQMVSFSDPTWQLERYLNVLEEAGFTELKFPSLSNSLDERLWRLIPHRKWYATKKGMINSSKEVVLFHRLKD